VECQAAQDDEAQYEQVYLAFPQPKRPLHRMRS
jgi:hypothetical protein